jgi:hypothetical protein
MSLVVDGSRLFVGGRKAGWITQSAEGKNIFISLRDRTHFFRNFQGWGISQEVFQYLRLAGVQEIHLRIDRATTLISAMADWKQHAAPYHKEPYEPQLILPEKYMKKEKLALSQIMEL